MKDSGAQMARHEQDKYISLRVGESVVATAKTTDSGNSKADLTNRWLLLACWIVLSSLLFSTPLVIFVRMALSDNDSSYLVLIPFISAWILFIERHKIVLSVSYDKMWGCNFLFFACCAVFASRFVRDSSLIDVQLSGYILSLVLVWVAGFIFLFGKTASKAGSFPLLFLFLMVPPPKFLLDHVIYSLQVGSAWITEAFFDLLGIPALRDGFVFHLARVNIEVAKECSGIHSSIALLILALLVSHFRLKSFWAKILLVSCGLFMMVLKNGIRIATLTLLAMYVNPDFLTGRLHHQGGVVFFLLGLLLLLPVLLLLQHGESASSPSKKEGIVFSEPGS